MEGQLEEEQFDFRKGKEEDMLLELNDSCEQYGMKINANKKKTIVIRRKIKKVNVRIRNETVEQVDSFKYLGCTISSNMSCCQEVKRRIAMTKEAFNRKRRIFREPLGKESLMLAGSEFQSLGRAIVKEDEYEEVRWDGFCDLHVPVEIIIHVNEGDNVGEMSPGSSTESYPAFACIGLRENPGKNLNQITCPYRDSNPGHLVSRPDALTVTPQIDPADCYEIKLKTSVMSRLLEMKYELVIVLPEKPNAPRTLTGPYLEISMAWTRSLPSKETLRGHSDSSFRGEGYIQCCVGVRLCDMYSNQELAEIHFMYGKADGNAALARRLYQERYPQRQCPDRKTFVRLHYRLCEYGKFNSPGLGRGRPRSTTPEVQEEILEAVNMTPSISTRRVALPVNVPHMTVWRLLKEYQLYPYHLKCVQALSPADYSARVRFCQWFLQQCGVNPNFPALVLFTDEAQFTRDGITNFHNQHVWAIENPRATVPSHHQVRFSLNMWSRYHW
ncbi:hypothetical protein ANN_11976 [Periplaneta americana]|uniref:DUF4817 domain-containing protein n=1 Tax=Periplaneta americana TaxID=6978 RepID=A0ABQ8T8U7_PERAM|nr:hypothetical protein ANN_11976 [Periplaneta americana]